MRNDHSRLVFSIVAGSECYLRESPVLEHPERSRSILDKVHLGAAGVLFIDNRLPSRARASCLEDADKWSSILLHRLDRRCGNERPFARAYRNTPLVLMLTRRFESSSADTLSHGPGALS